MRLSGLLLEGDGGRRKTLDRNDRGVGDGAGTRRDEETG